MTTGNPKPLLFRFEKGDSVRYISNNKLGIVEKVYKNNNYTVKFYNDTSAINGDSLIHVRPSI